MTLPNVDSDNNTQFARAAQPRQVPGVRTNLSSLHQDFSDPGSMIEGVKFTAFRALVSLGAVYVARSMMSAKLETQIAGVLPLAMLVAATGFYFQVFDHGNRTLRILASAAFSMCLMFAVLTAPPLILSQLFLAIVGITFATLLACSVMAVTQFYAAQRLWAVFAFGLICAYLSLSSTIPAN